LSGGDITTEAAITKMMFLLANETDESEIKKENDYPTGWRNVCFE
jgi:L-asparaginase